MKRLTAGILTAALILALAGTTALASGRCHGRHRGGRHQGCHCH